MCACVSDDHAGSVSTAVDSAAGYPVYRHSGTPPQWHAELVITVGADTGGVYEFGRVQSIVLDSKGALYVLDPTLARVSVFDSLGRFVATRGRKGRGPGEFVSPQSIAMLSDSLAVFAPSSRKLVLFAPDGEWIRTDPSSAAAGPQDLILYRTPPQGFWTATAYVQQGIGIRRAFIRYPSGATGGLDTITSRAPRVESAPPITCSAGSGGFSMYAVPFGLTGFARPIGGGEQAILLNMEYRIAIVGPTGDTMRVLERDVVRSPISDEDWGRETDKFRAWREGRGDPTCTRDAFERPPAHPVFEWMFLDDERRLWVETYSPNGSVYEVFGVDGSLIAAVTGLPPSRGVDPSVANGRIALYAPDENDIPRVQVFRIVGESRDR